MYNKKTFNGKALSIQEQANLLASQGLLIPSIESACFHLTTVNYHRLSAYFSSFYHEADLPQKRFKSNTQFDDVWDLYVFDRKLRTLVTDALERIEIALRTGLINHMSLKYSPHWYIDDGIFKDKRSHAIFLEKIHQLCDKSKEHTMLQYKSQFEEPKYPPSWILIECLTFGECSSLFRNIKHVEDKKEISKIFGYHPTLIDSWITALNYSRNACAHHSRLWNKWFVYEPKDIPVYNHEMKNRKPFYQHACVIKKLLKSISPGTHWVREFYSLISEYKHFQIWQMGFINDWENDPFWKDL